MLSNRTCIVHVGTHKTGTTTLQTFFQENVLTFGAAGLHVAQAGRVVVPYEDGTSGASPGHHEIAWELLAGRSKHLSALLYELTHNPSRNAIISSEDFSLLYARPAGLELLRDGLNSIGYTPKVVVYLRVQPPYVESMYVERIKHQYVRPLAEFLGTIFETGHYLPDGTAQNIQFVYTTLLEPFVKVFGREHVVVRAYVPDPNPQHLVQDFLKAIGSELSVPGSSLRFAFSYPRENQSYSFAGLLATLHLALFPGVALPSSPMDFMKIHARAPDLPQPLVLGRYSLLQRDEYVQFLQRFAPSNRKIEIIYGAHIPFVTQADVPEEGDPLWETARAERDIFDRCLATWTAASAPGNK